MKFSEAWLREWVNPSLTTDALCERLTMAGLEIESCEPAAQPFTGVVVGQVLSKTKHPEADRLNVCEVNVGGTTPLQIVCGASNVTVGMKAPVAMVGATLPGITIKAAKLRGVESAGMMCSATELGLIADNDGLLVLAEDAPIGADLRSYLGLDDTVIEVSITPNRGDCLSIQGMAREVSALTQAPLTLHEVHTIKGDDSVPAPVVKVSAKPLCPRYVSRLVRGVKADAPTPVWMKERLRRSGIRSISVIVDIVNYVMLELGQPMHAFDADKLRGGIHVRIANEGEHIALLDGSEKTLQGTTLVIADEASALAIAGVMGGMPSSVTLSTTSVLLESAYFLPSVIASQRQRYQLTSDSAFRFERGVDASLPRLAMERATDLICQLAGGTASAMTEVMSDVDLPSSKSIFLPEAKLKQVLGVTVPASVVSSVFKALSFPHVKRDDGWTVSVPSYRTDVTIPEDLIEEVARVHGYDAIPLVDLPLSMPVSGQEDKQRLHLTLRQQLASLGMHEIVSYSFVEPQLRQTLDPDNTPETLMNPMSNDMSVMRTSLWPGLIHTLRYNQSRQQPRVRLFEIGTVFLQTQAGLIQPPSLAGLIAGDALPEQWGEASRPSDFFDMKGVLEGLFEAIFPGQPLSFTQGNHPALHPGQAAHVSFNGVMVGYLGALHPEIRRKLDISGNVYLFELNLDKIKPAPAVACQAISKFPEIRRDLALVVDQTIPSVAIQDTIKSVAGDWLKTCFVFDVYQGKGISPGQKSLAVALLLQHPTRTLVDDEVATLQDRVVTALKDQLGVELRS